MLRSLLAFLFFLSSYFLDAQSSIPDASKESVLKISKTGDFEITGDGIARNWDGVEWLSLPHRVGEISYKTSIKLLYSDEGIYCLFKCDDKKITATLKEDFLDLYNEDVVEVFFWTDEKVPVYFEYELSPLNYELPILVPNNKGDFFGWRPWHYEGKRKTRHETHINKVTSSKDSVTSWMAEFFIPFALLKPLTNVPPQKGTRWRANFYRIDYDSGISEWSWQQTLNTFHEYKKFGTILFE